MSDVGGMSFPWKPLQQGTKEQRIRRLAAALEEAGVDPDLLGQVKQIRLGEHTGYIKNSDGEIQYTDPLPNASVVLDPSWSTGPKWPVVQPAAKRRAYPSRAQPRRADLDRGLKRAVILPDPQIGFRRLEDGTLLPMHDHRAMAAALRLVALVRPNLVINIGDLVDLAEMSRHKQEPSFQRTVQPTLDAAHNFLAIQRATAPPGCEIVVLEGNHDKRMLDYILENAAAAFGIRPANRPDHWPTLSIPFLLHFNDLQIQYVEGYPNGTYWVNNELKVIHGKKAKSGSTVASVAKEEHTSTIQGHIHRVEEHWVTVQTRRGPKEIMASSPGCLTRIDGGIVPSFSSSYDAKGHAVGTPENWQHGAGVVLYDSDEWFDYQSVRIRDGVSWWGGERVAANDKDVEALGS